MYNSLTKRLPSIFKHNILHCWVWVPFFISPFLATNTSLGYLSANILFFATGLFATASIWNPNIKNKPNTKDIFPYIFISLSIIPIFILLINQELRSPWHAFQGSLYIISAWLVYQMSKEQSAHIITSKYFLILITTFAYLYVMFSLLQAWDMRFFVGDRLFPVWTSRVSSFPGPLMQQNFEGLFLILTTIVLLFHASKQTTPFLFIISVIPTMGVFLTNSRASILLLISISLLFAFLHRKKRFFLLSLTASLFIALLLTMLVNHIGIISSEYTIPSELNPFNRFATGDLNARFAIWLMAIQLAFEHPILGIGWMNMAAYNVDVSLIIIQQYPNLATAISNINSGGNLWAHNIILQFAMCAGFMGICAISMILYYFLTHLKSTFQGIINHQSTSLGNLLALTIFLHGMVSVSIMQPFFMVLFAFFLAAGTSKSSEN